MDSIVVGDANGPCHVITKKLGRPADRTGSLADGRVSVCYITTNEEAA